jgi:magnesium-transporting ATPase (P-type)
MSDSDKIKLTVLPTETMHADLTWLLINPARDPLRPQVIRAGFRAMSSGDAAEYALHRLLLAGPLANEAQLDGDGDTRIVLGDPTDGALLVAAERAGTDLADLFSRHPPRAVLPFDSARQYMASAPSTVDGGPVVSYLKGAPEETLAVTSVAFFQIFYLLVCRTLTAPVRSIGWTSNPYVFAGIGVLLVLQVGFVHLPAMQALFRTADLTATDWLLAAAVGATVIPVVAAEKTWRRTRATSDQAGPTHSTMNDNGAVRRIGRGRRSPQ